MPKTSFKKLPFTKTQMIKITSELKSLDMSNELKRLFLSTFVVIGEKDRANKKAAQEIHKGITNSKFHTLKGGHELNKDCLADRVSSHGIDRFGLTYAFDFIKVDWDKPDHPTHDKNKLEYFLGGIPLNSYYCFGEPIYATFSGEVVTIENSVLDGEKASWLDDQTSAIKNSFFSLQLVGKSIIKHKT